MRVAAGTSTLARRLHPARWGIAARSAAVSAAMVLAALTIAAALLLAVMVHSLLGGIDDAAAGRVSDIAMALESEGPAELDAALLGTNDHISVVQVADSDGVVLVRSTGAPPTSLVRSDVVGPSLRRGIRAAAVDDVRLAAQRVHTATGTYTVIAGAGSEAVETTVSSVAGLLAVAAPAVAAVAALASYQLVRRSLSSVDAIRREVAQISTSDLAARVPVPGTQDEVAALAQTMNAMLARVEAGHRAQRQFVGDASHELRSPLATLISALEVVEAHPHLLDMDLATGTLLPEAQRMRGLVEDLLLLARADETGLPVDRRPVALDAILIAEAVRLRRHTGLAVSVDAEHVDVLGDHDALTRVVRNVADNAVRHARSGIELSAHRRGDAIEFVIADDGPGIPVADRRRVFDRFVRLDTDRSRKGGGSGLGLAIVAEIVAAHHGSIRIDERPAGGTAVTVALPSATRHTQLVPGDGQAQRLSSASSQ